MWDAMDEVLGVLLEGRGQGRIPMDGDALGVAVVHVGRGHERDTDVAAGFVVPAEEGLTERAAILYRGEVVREIGPVLERLELRLRKWVVVGREWLFVTPISARSPLVRADT